MYVVTEDWYFVSHRLSLAQAAQDAGYDVVVLTRLGRYRKVLEESGFHVHHLKTARRSINPFTEFVRLIRIAAIMRHYNPDIVHLVALKPVVVAGVAARLVGIRGVVASIAGLGFLYNDKSRLPLVRMIVGRIIPWVVCDGGIIVQNPEDRMAVSELGIAEDRIRLIPGVGVDLSVFTPSDDTPSGPPIVMLASRLLRDKGVEEFVKAAHMLISDGVCARFVLVGEPDNGNPTSVTDSQLHEWLATNTVEWWGQQTDMASVLQSATLVCLPSYREGLPKVLLEASACGKAIVTTNVPGCRDVVRDGKEGLLVEARDSVGLAEAIRKVLADGALRASFGRYARERAVEYFAESDAIKATLLLYSDVV